MGRPVIVNARQYVIGEYRIVYFTKSR